MVGLASITAVGILVEYRFGYNAFYTWTGALLPGTTPPPDIGTYDSIGRLTVVCPGGHPLAPATMMAVALPFALTGVLASRERRTKLAYGAATGLMLGAALATQRKTSLVLPLAVLIVLASYRPRQLLRMLPLGLVMLALIHAVAPGAIGGVGDQLKPSALTGVLTTKDRVSDYDAIKPDAANHLLFGRGYESYDQKKIRILDNQYLTLLVNVGVLGVLAYLAMLAAAIGVAGRAARARDPGAARIGVASVAAVVALVVGSALMDTLALPQVPYLFCFVAALSVVTVRAHRDTA
jgi:O-antigen ligase